MNAKSKFATCRHVKTNGRICQSPALTGGALCYFHRNLHHTHRRPAEPEPLFSEWQEDEIQRDDPTGDDILVLRSTYPHQDEIRFPALEDAESVQLATSMLFQSIATGQIAFRRARMLIATLKIACINQRALANSRAADADPTARSVRNTQGHILAAPDQEEAAEIVTPANANPEHSTGSPTVSLELSSLKLETQAVTPPPPNSNDHRNLAVTHLDTGFCRRHHPTNT
jgi:hypothetical protein